MRQDRENQFWTERLERAVVKWTRSTNSHTGPRHMTAAQQGRTHVSTRLRAELQKILLALRGASTPAQRAGARSRRSHGAGDRAISASRRSRRSALGLFAARTSRARGAGAGMDQLHRGLRRAGCRLSRGLPRAPAGTETWQHSAAVRLVGRRRCYFRDPDGNKLCVCCHAPVPAP